MTSPAKKGAAKKALPAAPARTRPAPPRAAAPEPTVIEGDEIGARVVADGEVPIDFHGRTIAVTKPTDEQMALLIDMAQWVRGLGAIQAEVSALPADTPASHPTVVKGQKLLESGMRRIGRITTILSTLMPEDEWERIQDRMAAQEIPWQDVANLPAEIVKAHNEADILRDDNRASRRAGGHRGRRVT